MKFNLETVILFAQDVDKLKVFYVDIFELDIVEEFESEWLLLQAGNCRIGLHKIGENYSENNPEAFKSDSNTKLVFEIDEDIFKVRERLLNENVSIREIKTFENYGFWVCDGEDPEGNVFQLKQRKESQK
ncbi:VOC family protein [Runella sp.]|jgi:predicted enzyme related to lactoylglutathione lyase|uniref:VOC family protein n=1 Tax=Runella sp. TaxID=1960881 RepID=UPI00261F10C5|nr:VOC family protein [Runella sp.]